MKNKNSFQAYEIFLQNFDVKSFTESIRTLTGDNNMLKRMLGLMASDFYQQNIKFTAQQKQIEQYEREIKELSLRNNNNRDENQKLMSQSQLFFQQKQKLEDQINLKVSQPNDTQTLQQQDTIVKLKKENENLRQSIIKLSDIQQKLESSNQQLTSSNNLLISEQQKLNDQKKKQQEKVNLSQKTIEELEEKIKQLQNQPLSEIVEQTDFLQYKIAHGEAESLKIENKELQEQLNSVKVQFQDLFVWKQKLETEKQVSNEHIVQSQEETNKRLIQIRKDETIELQSQLLELKNSLQSLQDEYAQQKESKKKVENNVRELQDQNAALLQSLEKMKETLLLTENREKSLLNSEKEIVLNYQKQIDNLSKTIQKQQQHQREQLQLNFTLFSLQQSPFINNLKLKEIIEKLQESWSEVYQKSEKVKNEIMKFFTSLRINCQDQQKYFVDSQKLQQLMQYKEKLKEIIQQIINIIELIGRKKSQELDMKERFNFQQIIDLLTYNKSILDRNCNFIDSFTKLHTEFQKEQENIEKENLILSKEIESKIQESNTFVETYSTQVSKNQINVFRKCSNKLNKAIFKMLQKLLKY